MFVRLQRFRKVKKGQEEFVPTPDNAGLTYKQLDNAHRVVKALGLADDGQLDRKDLLDFLYTMGMNPTDDLVEAKLRSLKAHQLESLTFGHFCHVWKAMMKDLQDEEEMLKKAFQFFDKDGNGEVSVTELKTTMHELGDLLTEQEIQDFVSIMDDNSDGVISYDEFIQTLKSQPGINQYGSSPSFQRRDSSLASPSSKDQPVSPNREHRGAGSLDKGTPHEGVSPAPTPVTLPTPAGESTADIHQALTPRITELQSVAADPKRTAVWNLPGTPQYQTSSQPSYQYPHAGG